MPADDEDRPGNGVLGGRGDGLQYLLFKRYYSQHLARFLNTDPKGGKIGSSQSWNKYVYCLNNSIIYLDPNGEEASLFIVYPAFHGRLEKDEAFGHAAMYVDSSGGSGGISWGGKQFDDGVGSFLEHYTGRGSYVMEYQLNLTNAQESAALAHILSASDPVSANSNMEWLSRNCTTAVVNTLKASGAIGRNSALGTIFGGLVYWPFKLDQQLMSEKGRNQGSGLVKGLVVHPPQQQEIQIPSPNDFEDPDDRGSMMWDINVEGTIWH